MNKSKLFLYLSVALCMLVMSTSCSKLDNYGAPNAQLSGSIKDSETGELIQSDIINGTTIKIVEHGYNPVTPQYLIVKNDGTYSNTMLFANTYTIQPEQRNFMQLDSQVVKLGVNTNLDFLVTPYIRVKDVSIEQQGNVIIATFKLQQLTADPVGTIGLYANTQPIVGQPARTVATEKVLNRSVGQDEVFRIGINAARNSAFLATGGKYYFRVGAVSSFPGAKFNYAPATQLVLGTIDPNAEPQGLVWDNCEALEGWNSDGTLSLDPDAKEGNYSVKTALNKQVTVFSKTFSTPFDTQVSMENGVFSFWMYVSDLTMLPTNLPNWGSSIEITSAAQPDNQEIHWDFSQLSLHNGWNKVDLKLSDATIDNRGGDINLHAVNWFRMYTLFCNGAVDVKIDNLMFYENY